MGALYSNSTVTISIADEAKLIVNQPMAVELNGKLQAKGTITGNMVNISLDLSAGTPIGNCYHRQLPAGRDRAVAI